MNFLSNELVEISGVIVNLSKVKYIASLRLLDDSSIILYLHLDSGNTINKIFEGTEKEVVESVNHNCKLWIGDGIKHRYDLIGRDYEKLNDTLLYQRAKKYQNNLLEKWDALMIEKNDT